LRRHIAPQSIGSPPFRQTNPACPVSSPVPPRAPRDERRRYALTGALRTRIMPYDRRITRPPRPGAKEKADVV
jgi:hypothetical protein